MIPTACSVPRCPHSAMRRGRCALHHPPRDGYSPQWRAISLAMRRAHPRCRRCGTARDLTTDHIVAGGSDAAPNLRVLCRACHAVIGDKRSRRRTVRVEPADVESDEADDEPRDDERPAMRIV